MFWRFLACLSIALFPFGILSALYNGNPSFPMMPEKGMFISKNCFVGVKVGYEFDEVYDRKLHLVGQGLPHIHKSVNEAHLRTNLGVVTLNLRDRVELFTTLGTLSSSFKHHPVEEFKISYHSVNHFTWGGGGRVILAYWGDVQLSINASYLSCDSPLSSLKVNGSSYQKKGAEVDFREWQVGAGVSYRIKWFVPYLGVDYSDFRAKIEHLGALHFILPNNHLTLKDSYPMGLFLGFGLSPEKAVNVNVEARLINENAFSVSADFRF